MKYSYPADQKRIAAGAGPVFSELGSRSTMPLFPEITSHVVLDNCTKRILVRNYIEKIRTLDTEGAYYAFPFRVPDARMKIHCHNGFFEPENQQLPGSAKDWYSVQKAVGIFNTELQVIFSPLEAPLVQLGRLRTGQWLDRIEVDNGSIFSFIMNNYWWTNSPAEQGGRFSFSYALTSASGGFDPAAATRFGWEHHVPLSATYFSGQQDSQKPFSYSFFDERMPENVVLVGMKLAEQGRDVVLRLLETSGKNSTFAIGLSGRQIQEAWVINPVEQVLHPAGVTAGRVRVSLKPFELVSLQLQI